MTELRTTFAVKMALSPIKTIYNKYLWSFMTLTTDISWHHAITQPFCDFVVHKINLGVGLLSRGK